MVIVAGVVGALCGANLAATILVAQGEPGEEICVAWTGGVFVGLLATGLFWLVF